MLAIRKPNGYQIEKIIRKYFALNWSIESLVSRSQTLESKQQSLQMTEVNE